MSWEIEIELSGATAGPIRDRGAYKVKVLTTEMYVTDSGNQRMKYEVEVIEGPQAGKTGRGGMSVPTGESDWRKRLWFALLTSLGHKPEDVTSKFKPGGKKLKASDIEGRTGWIYYTPSAGQGTFSECEWYPSEAAAQAADARYTARVNSDKKQDDEIPF